MFPLFWIRLLITVPVILGESDRYCSDDFASGCWLLFILLWVRLLVIFPIIVDQADGYCSHYFV